MLSNEAWVWSYQPRIFTTVQETEQNDLDKLSVLSKSTRTSKHWLMATKIYPHIIVTKLWLDTSIFFFNHSWFFLRAGNMRVNFLQLDTDILLKWLLNSFHAQVKKKFSQCLVSLNWPITNRTGAVGFGAGTVRKGKWVLGQLLCIALH